MTIKRKDIRLGLASESAARQCLIVSYSLGLSVENTLALCAGIRQSCGIETADQTLFGSKAHRIFIHSAGLATKMVGHDSILAEKVADELERMALTLLGQSKIWRSLAAAVGDIKPDQADLRTIELFKALRGGRNLRSIEIRKSPRPSYARRQAAIATEREQVADIIAEHEKERLKSAAKTLAIVVKLASRGSPGAITLLEKLASQANADAVTLLAKPTAQSYADAAILDKVPDTTADQDTEIQQLIPATKRPGKFATRLLAYMHQGYILTIQHALKGTRTDFRCVPATPRFDRIKNPRFLIEYEEDFRLKNYDHARALDLEYIGWIVRNDEFLRDTYCLTEEGALAAVKLFGEPEKDLPIIDKNGRDDVCKQAENLLTGGINEDQFLQNTGIIETDARTIVEIVANALDIEVPFHITERFKIVKANNYPFDLN